MTVAPLTAAVLAGAGAEQSGIASGVNNAIARVAGLLGTAALGAIVAASFSSTLSRLAGSGLAPSGRAVLAQAKRLPLGRPDVHGLPAGQAHALARAAEEASLHASIWGWPSPRRSSRLGAWWESRGIRNPSKLVHAASCPAGQLIGASSELAQPPHGGGLEAQPTGSRA